MIARPVPRPYQVDSVDRVRDEYRRGVRRTLVVLPTGAGKTVVFAEVARLTVERLRSTGVRRRVLVLAHRTELLTQARSKLLAAGCEAALEQAGLRGGDAQVVVASVQTLKGKRLAAWARDAFDLIVIDEAHHALAASYRAILDHFETAYVLGVTATPDRADGKPLGDVFESCAYRYELRAAIRDGWLAPFVARRIDLDGVDLSGVRVQAGDLRADQLGEILGKDHALHAAAVPLLEQAGERKTIVFCADVAHAHRLADVLNGYRPGCARALDGESTAEEREASLAAFTAGAFQFLLNCQLFTEGFDCPDVSCVAVIRPTMSRALWTQMAGRGSRLADGKRDCLLLDFGNNSSRHRLVGPADVLAGREVDEEVAAEVARRAAEGQLELDGVLDQVEDELAARREHYRLTAVARYIAEEVDLFVGALDEDTPPVEMDPSWDLEPANIAQRRVLEDLGLEKLPDTLTRAQAERLRVGLSRRRELNLATLPQARLLGRQGIDARHMGKGEASRRIAELRNHWDARKSMRRAQGAA